MVGFLFIKAEYFHISCSVHDEWSQLLKEMWNIRVVNEKCRSFILSVVECTLQMHINVLLLNKSKKLHIETIAHVCIDVLLVCKYCLVI